MYSHPWFATSNGISFYQTDTKEWRSFFSSFDPVPNDENHIFLALCEVSSGVIWAGGYTSGIYKIEKKKGFKSDHSPTTGHYQVNVLSGHNFHNGCYEL